ncbi:quiescin Q6 sulfhydryl oxidase 2 precursor [Xenopus laevis]|uniref:Sulfhydryl oxidase n=1 Tax=Xenopus laevis TaxID=8355 RepID=A0JPG9_XENLA|nr:quiescin Q6 sulfhydryl oxidase 2 precursor [Xenopus laevis]AAI27419.1 Qscn6l1 protein [Xenopus laevis]
MGFSSSLCICGATLVLLLLTSVAPSQAALYSPDEPVVFLDTKARSYLLESRSFWLAEFYASWCGHCQNFKPTWSALAEDIKDWRPVVYLGVIDCAEASNSDTCTEFGVKGYPTVKSFKPFTKEISEGVEEKDHTIQALRETIIKRLEEQKDSRPPACPPLEPISAYEVEQFFITHQEDYLALIFEEASMYIGRETALDMVQYEGVSVRRVHRDQDDIVNKFQIPSFPALVLLCKNGSNTIVNMVEDTRSSYTNFLRSLPGVRKGNLPIIGMSSNNTTQQDNRRISDSSKLYLADLESAVHYTLRAEVSRFSILNGERLNALIAYVSVLKKYFPARPYGRTLISSMYSWLRDRAGTEVLYKDFQDVLDNKDKVEKAVLSSGVNFVWCQGSQSKFRGFPCSLWTLFHFLTVQAGEDKTANPMEVLSVLREYVKHFFGCRECAGHFESMAAESMSKVSSLDDAILWLWDRHNRVNKRLSGAPSEDPEFPKLPWPSKALCPLCQVEDGADELAWDSPNVLTFMKAHYSRENLASDYLEDEEVLLERQRNVTKKIETSKEKNESPFKLRYPSLITEDNKNENNPDADVPVHVKVEEEKNAGEANSFLRSLLPSRSLQGSVEHDSDGAIMPQILLDIPEEEFDHIAVRKRLLRRGIDGNSYINVGAEKGNLRWGKTLELGFSRLDISLCVVFYFLSSMCLLCMYLYMSLRKRCLRQRTFYP